MKKLLISIRDSKAETWSFPAPADNKATALRDFGTLVADGRTLVGQHPGDFDLFVLGWIDLSCAAITVLDAAEHLGNGLDFAKKE